MLDPGHGGRDPGAIGAGGTLEKDVTLDIARDIARHLNDSGSARALLTRTDDTHVALSERVAMARDARADLFVSIHADSAPNREARGLSAYTLSEKASDALAHSLAARENLADGAAALEVDAIDAEVTAILLDLTARHAHSAALRARSGIIEGAGRDLHLLDNPMRAAAFAVLKAPDVPSLLIETGFLSNREDEALLRSRDHRRRIAGILSREIASVMAASPFA